MAIPVHLLARFSLLESLPQETLLHLASKMSDKSFARREVVISKEQRVYALGFLLEGRLQGVDFTAFAGEFIVILGPAIINIMNSGLAG